MRFAIVMGLACWFACGSAILAQPTGFDPTRLNAPEQFYTNGVQVDAWNRDDDREQIVTYWFGKNPKDSISYRQLVAILQDADPDRIYYFDLEVRRFVGRYDMRKEKYSLLAPEHRRERVEDIREEWFPPPGEKPSVGELFDPPTNGEPNNDQLMMPPVTMMFPRLKNSAWKGFYTDIGAGRRRTMTMTINGNNGVFQAPSANIRGTLTNITYETRNGMQVMLGHWSAGSTGGGFEFRVMMTDLSEFQGEYWLGNARNRVFIWDGKRTSR